MPHFVIDCAQEVLEGRDQQAVLRALHQAALASGLFNEAAIKVRINSYATYLAGGSQDPFIHLFAHILDGRTADQRAELSKLMVAELTRLFPEVPKIAANVYEMSRQDYVSRQMLESGDGH
ncbi:5-carboxymethyl-2-hydroxymuconate Delta-isomerase [Ferrimonas sediminicola]|uniref:5-carboxymethyl-2-hydroxymuconate Delta-isomerase n=1 Tax=Ferrimonas sediminicola TaxID=2569538 RepID=A0A4U1BKJ7_9GAMM|nr:5-carboxymethyl-2-hydroxymuconate Delta-isomerase [Ferrimonas sediminicola]TKB50610.1 5-carboxymethyl-2-hydroxymuconate Delta-isomerase [Ferrimonas sediminicola]